MRLFFRSDYRSLYLLNATQFLGALNDNLFKLLIIFMIINVQGQQHANYILALAGAVFVIPFLLFSSAAGVLADRISKRSIIVAMKFTEVFVMGASVVTAYYQSPVGSYVLLFFMAMQSAFFGPSKYGILPELVDTRKISQANGLLTSFTYLAVILGTFFASFVTDITNKNFTIASSFCVVIAIIGLLASLGISKTPPKGTKKRINPLFFYEIYQSLKIAYEKEHLVTCIFGSGFFLFIGAFTQLNIIPFAMQSLGLSEVWGGYLFLFTAVGIAAGAVTAGKISKDKVEVGLSCLSAFLLSFFFFLLYFFSSNFWVVVFALMVIGFGGGLLLIPLDAFIQVNSPDHQRGRIIAAGNFMSFVGVLLASMFLYLIGDRLNFSAASGFGFMGVLTLIFSVFVTGRFAPLFFPFISNKILLSRYLLQPLTQTPPDGAIVVFQKRSWLDLFLFFSIIKRLKVIIQKNHFYNFPFFNGMFNNFSLVKTTSNSSHTLTKLMQKADRAQKNNETTCLFINENYSKEEIVRSFHSVFQKDRQMLFFAETKWDTIQKVFFSTSFRKNQMSISFVN